MTEQEELKARRDALKAALYQGVTTVHAGDKSVTYRSLAEMQSLLADIEDELAEKSGGRGKAKRILTYGTRGY